MTPWHCSIAVDADGSYRTVHAADVAHTHDLVHHNGRPYCFREKSDLYDWGDMKVSFEHLYPCGLIVRPYLDTLELHSLRSIDMAKLRGLANHQSPVIARGFANTTERGLFFSRAHEVRKVVPPSRSYHVPHLPDDDVSKHDSNIIVENDVAIPIDVSSVFQLATAKDDDTLETMNARDNIITVGDVTTARYLIVHPQHISH